MSYPTITVDACPVHFRPFSNTRMVCTECVPALDVWSTPQYGTVQLRAQDQTQYTMVAYDQIPELIKALQTFYDAHQECKV